MSRIVVGVDGSESSKEALFWAVMEAELRRGEVEVVHSWQYPTPAMTFEGVIPAGFDIDFAEEAKNEVERIVKDTLGGRGGSVPIRTTTPRGPAARVLIEASSGADLIVVGSRGRGGFAGLLLGSVSHQVAHHAKCPVVIVRT